MAEEVFLTPEERLAELSDQLISSSIGSDELSKSNRQLLFGQISPKVFKNENYIIFQVLYNFKDRGITPDEDFIKMYLLRNKKMIKESHLRLFFSDTIRQKNAGNKHINTYYRQSSNICAYLAKSCSFLMQSGQIFFPL